MQHLRSCLKHFKPSQMGRRKFYLEWYTRMVCAKSSARDKVQNCKLLNLTEAASRHSFREKPPANKYAESDKGRVRIAFANFLWGFFRPRNCTPIHIPNFGAELPLFQNSSPTQTIFTPSWNSFVFSFSKTKTKVNLIQLGSGLITSKSLEEKVCKFLARR